MYVIRNTDKTQDPRTYWSNSDGWVDITSADFFKRWERDHYNLPTDGEWFAVFDVDSIQFVRLIAEAAAAGVFTEDLDDRTDTDNPVRLMRESMGVSFETLYELIDRAQGQWEFYKNRCLQTPEEPEHASDTVSSDPGPEPLGQ